MTLNIKHVTIPKTKFMQIIDIIQWNFLGQTAMSGCEGFTDVSGTNSVPIFRVCWWFGRTKTDDYVANSALCL